MGIADLFRPKYRHSDVRVRAEAVRAMSADDATILAQIARTDRDVSVRRIAIEKLDEAELVAAIAQSETERGLRELATERAAQLWSVAACGDDGDEAAAALAGIIKLGDQHVLVELATRAAQATIRKRAFGELRDPRALADLAKSDAPQDVRAAAVGRIDDADVLRALAIDTTTKEVGLAAVDKLDDGERLEQVAQKAKNKAVRQRARKIVAEMAEAERAAKPGVPDEVKRRRAEKAQLIREVEAVADSYDFTKAEAAVKRAEEAWSKLAADDGDDRFTKTVARFWKRAAVYLEQARTADELRAVEREAAAERERAAAADKERLLAEAAERDRIAAERAAAKAARDAERSEPRDAGGGVPPPASPAEGGREAPPSIDRAVAVAASLAAMVDDLEKLADGNDTRAIDRALQQAVKVFEQLGKAPAAQREELADRYTAARGKLVVKLREQREAEDWLRWNNVPKAEALIARAKEFADEEPSADLANRLRALQALWKEVGPMPQRRSKELWEQFKAGCDLVYDKVKAFRAVETERFGEVAKVKEALIAEAEAVADSEDFTETAAKLKDLQARWKQSGHLPRKQGDELWKRFRAACDRFFERRRPILEARDAEEAANLAAKLALIARARDLVAAAPGEGGWGRAIGAIRDLQAEWKDIGYVPRRDADRIYREFRAACDALFRARDDARDGEANAHRAERDAVRVEIAAIAASGVFDDGAAMVARAVAVRARVGEAAGDGDGDRELRDAVAAMIRHVVSTHAAVVAGTELDPAAARARRGKLIDKAEELVPKLAPAVAGDGGDVAAQLKQAMRANAFGSLRFSGRDPVEVVDELRAAWRDAGPILDDADRAQEAAFEDACRRALGAAGSKDGGAEPRSGGAERERDGRRRRRDRRSAEQPIVHVAPAAVEPVAAVPQPTAAAPMVTEPVVMPVEDRVTAPASPPPMPAAEPAPTGAVVVAEVVVAAPSPDITKPLGLAGLATTAPAPAAAAEAVEPPPAAAAEPPAELAEPPRAKSLSQAPPLDELDTGWDLGDEDPTASAAAESPAAESPPSATEMAGDGATGGDGITDDPGWD
jgi:hypothetical protein